MLSAVVLRSCGHFRPPRETVDFRFAGEFSLKPYPSGSLTHPAMTEIARLITVENIQADQVEKVDVGANHNMTTTLLHHRPKKRVGSKIQHGILHGHSPAEAKSRP